MTHLAPEHVFVDLPITTLYHWCVGADVGVFDGLALGAMVHSVLPTPLSQPA